MPMRYRTGGAPARKEDAALDLTLRVRAILNVSSDTVVSVAGHRCGDPDCDEGATTILLMRPDQPTRGFKIAKAMEAVTEADLRSVFQPILCQEGQPEP